MFTFKRKTQNKKIFGKQLETCSNLKKLTQKNKKKTVQKFFKDSSSSYHKFLRKMNNNLKKRPLLCEQDFKNTSKEVQYFQKMIELTPE